MAFQRRKRKAAATALAKGKAPEEVAADVGARQETVKGWASEATNPSPGTKKGTRKGARKIRH